MTYPVPPPRQRRSTKKIVLLVVGVVLAVCCVGGSVGGYAIYRAVTAATGPARAAVGTFLTNLEAGKHDAAYDSLCRSTRERFSRERFAQLVAERPKLTGHVLTGVNVSNNNGRIGGTVTATMKYADGGSESHAFELVKEGDSWRICGDPY